MHNVNSYMDKIIQQYNFLISNIMETQLSKRSKLEKINNNLVVIGEESVRKISSLEEAIRNIKIQLEN